MAATAQPRCLVDLPSPCLLAIMQHCSSHYHSLFNTAQAHSALHATAVAALSSITLVTANQAALDTLLTYLEKYGQHVKQFSLSSDHRLGQPGLELLQLPPTMRLESLSLNNIDLQLQPGNGCAGVLVGQPALKQLKMHFCLIRDGADGLAAAPRELPGLENLQVTLPQHGWDIELPFPGMPRCKRHRCCPDLAYLEAPGALEFPDSIAALGPLSGLQNLLLTTLDNVDRSVCDAFVKLRGLKQLRFGFVCTGPETPEQQSARTLVHLTQLTQLTRLHVWAGISDKTFECKGALDQPVWQRIQEYCSSRAS